MSAIPLGDSVPQPRKQLEIEKIAPISLILGLVGLLGLFVTKTSMTAMYQSYLFGWVFWMSITMG